MLFPGNWNKNPFSASLRGCPSARPFREPSPEFALLKHHLKKLTRSYLNATFYSTLFPWNREKESTVLLCLHGFAERDSCFIDPITLLWFPLSGKSTECTAGTENPSRHHFCLTVTKETSLQRKLFGGRVGLGGRKSPLAGISLDSLVAMLWKQETAVHFIIGQQHMEKRSKASRACATILPQGK